MSLLLKILRRLTREVFKILPFVVQVPLARGRPELAFYIRPRRGPDLVIDYYLAKYKILVQPENDVERRLLSGSYESDTMAVIRDFVRPGMIAVDVGANVGAITLALADAVGEGGRVEAIEPGPQFFTRLEANLALNPELKGRVRTHSVGLAASEGKLIWQPSVVVSGTASTYRGQIDPAHPSLEIPAHSFDRFAVENEIARVDFLKIDVDGIELDVLLGAEKTLSRDRPTLYVEINTWNDEMREHARKIDEFLTRLGYRFYNVSRRGVDLRPTRYPNFSFNVLAKHSEAAR